MLGRDDVAKSWKATEAFEDCIIVRTTKIYKITRCMNTRHGSSGEISDVSSFFEYKQRFRQQSCRARRGSLDLQLHRDDVVLADPLYRMRQVRKNDHEVRDAEYDWY